MQALTLRQRSLVGLTLFAMFFGAGNLIFPPWLGVQAGTESLSAFIGFLITAVGFPILGVMAVAESGGLKNLGARVHPVFAFIFMFLIYLSIGPCLAIPRTASTSFEMVVRPLLAENGLLEAPLLGWTALGFSQLAYSVLFFLAAFLVALNPEKLTSRLGKFLCPTLITLICVLWLGAFVNPIGEAGAPAAAYAGAALAHGFIDGYQTMDTLAALNFGLIIAMNIRAMGIKSEGAVVKETVFAGCIAAAVFFVVYGALTQIGAEAGGAFTGMENGAQTLTAVADKLFGTAGQARLLHCMLQYLRGVDCLLLGLFLRTLSQARIPRLGRGICGRQHGDQQCRSHAHSEVFDPGAGGYLSARHRADRVGSHQSSLEKSSPAPLGLSAFDALYGCRFRGCRAGSFRSQCALFVESLRRSPVVQH